MDVSKYSQAVIDTIKEAHKIAIKNENLEVTELHIMYCILKNSDNEVIRAITNMGIVVKSLTDDIKNAISKLKSPKGVTNLYVSRAYQKVLIVSQEIARSMYDSLVSQKHIFLAILKEDYTQGAQIAQRHNLNYEILEKEFDKINSENIARGITDETLKELSKYGRNLTKEAIDGKLDPIIGRDEETKGVIRILSRRIKNNPVLIGEAGVGKTAIVEGLVQRIVKQDVPDILKDKIVFALDMTSLIAGAKYRGDFEDRLKKLLEIIKDSNGKIIMFIDELHNIIGAGNTSGTMDTSNILKPMLARGEILVVGATTLDEYKKYIEKDGALERRFQKILVEEPTQEDTISILRGIKSKYERHHKVQITDLAIIDAVKLSQRYLSSRKLPDIAIDIIDEASSLVRMYTDERPLELEDLNRKILQLETEKVLLKREVDEVSKHRLAELEKTIEKEKNILLEKEDAYIKEKQRQEEISNLQTDLELISLQIEDAKEKHSFDKLGDLMKLKEETDNNLNKVKSITPYYPLRIQVTQKEVKEIVAKLAGMPEKNLETDELALISNLKENLKYEFIGSENMIDRIVDAYIRSRGDLVEKNRPIGAYLLAGSSGVGKSYIAKLLANYIYDGEKSLVALDMSEFTDKSSITKLIGAPPGYIGFETGGAFTETIRTRPYSVILFDNIDMAQLEVAAIISQIIKNGKISDSKGRNIDFKNTVIICTVNIDSDKNKYLDLLKTKLQFSFLSSFDEIFFIEKFDKKSIKKVAKLSLQKLSQELSTNQINLVWDEEVEDELITYFDYENMGAIAISNAIEQYILTPISMKNLQGKLKKFSTVRLVLDEENNIILQD
ncbi:hypothetical protein HMPREF9630_00491 [Peptoanaerobacter stomatis]|uniref:Clp R domain-containing protein n=1 Tax=Peptoanaerobacter stomatis TaxID=796937 RepID=V9HKH1_9FIRM|nr:AAA family ATPase [Peptoanaerobacter stomatis]EHL17324.1 hypothetical protein HMPREF9630_00491 [Peptoanaerobacter stomatis]